MESALSLAESMVKVCLEGEVVKTEAPTIHLT